MNESLVFSLIETSRHTGWILAGTQPRPFYFAKVPRQRHESSPERGKKKKIAPPLPAAPPPPRTYGIKPLHFPGFQFLPSPLPSTQLLLARYQAKWGQSMSCAPLYRLAHTVTINYLVLTAPSSAAQYKIQEKLEVGPFDCCCYCWPMWYSCFCSVYCCKFSCSLK